MWTHCTGRIAVNYWYSDRRIRRHPKNWGRSAAPLIYQVSSPIEWEKSTAQNENPRRFLPCIQSFRRKKSTVCIGPYTPKMMSSKPIFTDFGICGPDTSCTVLDPVQWCKQFLRGLRRDIQAKKENIWALCTTHLYKTCPSGSLWHLTHK